MRLAQAMTGVLLALALLAGPLRAEEAGRYTVAPGDTPVKIAGRLGLDTARLLAANPGLDPRRLMVGQVLRLPAAEAVRPPEDRTNDAAAPDRGPGGTPRPRKTDQAQPCIVPDDSARGAGATHVIAPGDTPAEVARRFGVSLEALLSANGDPDPAKLAVGATLTIPPPGSGAPSAGSAPAALTPGASPAPLVLDFQ